jgi:hypothetical protein
MFFTFFKKDRRKKVVFQLTLDGKFITEYKSVSKTLKLTGFNKISIAKVCRSERKNGEGNNWIYK